MQKKRIEAICSFLDRKDKLIDIGCDHAYVSVELARRGAKHILATDIHRKALESAKENIKKAKLENVIQTKLCDGLQEIDTSSYDTIVIAGMGTSTIEHILSDMEKLKPINKIILQSNQDLYELRKYMNKINYFLEEEKIVREKNHYYTVMKYRKGKQKLKNQDLYFGFYQKEYEEYYQYLLKKNEGILKKIPKKYWYLSFQTKRKIKWLTKWIKDSNL